MCSYFREGSVCTVPNSDGKRLAEMFGSRDPDKIIDALGEWNQKMAARALDALDDEIPEKTALDPTVSTALKQVFDNGVKLSKLINPNLEGKGGGTTVNVGISMSGQRPQVTAQRTDESHTRELAATVIAELEAEGHARSQITESMVREKLQEYVAKETGRQPQSQPVFGMEEIEGEVIDDDD